MSGDRVAELAGLTVRALEDLRYAILAPPGAGRAHAARQVGAAVEAITSAFPASVPVEEPVEPQASESRVRCKCPFPERHPEAHGEAPDQVAESSTVARRRADAEAEPGTLMGQDAGDGLDQERADARTAIELVRLMLRVGLLEKRGDGIWTGGDRSALVSQLDPIHELLDRLAAQLGPLPPAGRQPTEWRTNTSVPTYPREGEG